jgi:hypothetical protein
MPFRALQLAVPTGGDTGSEVPWLGDEVVLTVLSVTEVVVLVVVVGVDESEVVEEVVVVHVTAESSPSPPEQPLPKEMGTAALDVFKPIATDVTRKTKTKPTITRAAFRVLILVAVEEESANIVLQYRSQIYITVLNDFNFLNA